jgi:hypothetical protein
MPNSVRELKELHPGAKVHKVANNTYRVVVPEEYEHFVLHRTPVVTRHATGWETWRTGGYRTHTTKDRINRFARNGHVVQEKWQWYVVTARGRFLFDFDRIQVSPTGYVYSMDAVMPLMSIEDMKAAIKARKETQSV